MHIQDDILLKERLHVPYLLFLPRTMSTLDHSTLQRVCHRLQRTQVGRVITPGGVLTLPAVGRPIIITSKYQFPPRCQACVRGHNRFLKAWSRGHQHHTLITAGSVGGKLLCYTMIRLRVHSTGLLSVAGMRQIDPVSGCVGCKR